jgi:hypothetical protein
LRFTFVQKAFNLLEKGMENGKLSDDPEFPSPQKRKN